MDLEIDGRDLGRVDFELFGNAAPKSVNNFLGFVTGEFDRYLWYKNSYFLTVYQQRFALGGDFLKNDGSGSATVYPDSERMPAEENHLKFTEPYLLAMACDAEGKTGSQFFVTFSAMPCLDKSKHTIIGRVLKGKHVVDKMEFAEAYHKAGL